MPPGETSRRIDLRVVYADGSEAEPFPLFCLPRAGAGSKNSVSPLRVALMSMRHLELDSEIDFCWFRNREVSRTWTLAETDSFCFDATREQLRDSLALGDLAMHLYHTGFEPAVLGFYRGLVHTLLALKQKPQSPSLSITPYYLRDGQKLSGRYTLVVSMQKGRIRWHVNGLPNARTAASHSATPTIPSS